MADAWGLVFKKIHILPAGHFTQPGRISSLSQLQICSETAGFFPELGYLASQ